MPIDHHDAIERLLDHYRQPRHYGELADAVSYSGGVPDCGDTITVYLQVASDGRLAGLQFTGQGCSVSIGTASILIEQLQGATLADLLALDEASAPDIVGSEIMQARPHCATLAFKVLKTAARLAERHQAN
ncbi:iron-sulfur cluster assembly scaffold protein [Chloroflexus sp.]|uniref:iron-sulfur cluster assembly scaffold protein n=1 Tax=Chloroflexus sp. TaxID=1904827 RepID=UPI00262FE1AE|nr:iron-sulfur cluster assembly scaffold protein [uncultured Chloroflexus sp.]